MTPTSTILTSSICIPSWIVQLLQLPMSSIPSGHCQSRAYCSRNHRNHRNHRRMRVTHASHVAQRTHKLRSIGSIYLLPPDVPSTSDQVPTLYSLTGNASTNKPSCHFVLTNLLHSALSREKSTKVRRTLHPRILLLVLCNRMGWVFSVSITISRGWYVLGGRIT